MMNKIDLNKIKVVIFDFDDRKDVVKFLKKKGINAISIDDRELKEYDYEINK